MKNGIAVAAQIRASLKEVAQEVAPYYKLDVNSPDALIRGMRGIDGKSLASLIKEAMRDAVEDRSFAEQLQKDTTLWQQLENVSNSHEVATALHAARSPMSTLTTETHFAVYADIRNGDFLVKEQVNDNARESGSASTIGREKSYKKSIELIDAKMQPLLNARTIDGVKLASSGRHIGPVTDIKDGCAIQSIGRGELIAHDLSKLSINPKVGETLNIQYRNGFPEVLKSKSHERDSSPSFDM